jgi:hypothetical protein
MPGGCGSLSGLSRRHLAAARESVPERPPVVMTGAILLVLSGLLTHAAAALAGVVAVINSINAFVYRVNRRG